MVNEEQCMEIILEKFPGFESSWKKHLDWWGDESPGFYNDMAEFSHYVISLIQHEKNKLELEKIFFFMEALMVEGSDEVKNAVATCFLENLINAVSWGRIPAASFIHLLGDESKKYCRAWDEFTGVKTEGLWNDDFH